MQIKLSWKIVVGALVALSLVISGYAALTGMFIAGGSVDDFAKCLTEKGVVMYGAEWCPHCQNQKKLFGNSWQFVAYVECPENMQLCNSRGVQYYPTWEIDGRLYVGEQSLESLSSFSGCSL